MRPVCVILGIVGMAVAFSLIGAAQAQADIVPAVQWLNDEGTGTTTADDSGNGGTGTISGGVTWSTDTPFAYSGNHSLSFDGVGGSKVVAASEGYNSYQFGTGDFSVQAWIKSATAGEDDAILSTRATGYSRGFTFALGASGAGFRPRFYFWTSEKSATTDIAVGQWTSNVVDNQWHQLVAVWDSTTYTGKMYIDGALNRTLAVGSAPGSVSPSSQSLTAGQQCSNTSYNFPGLMDEVLLVGRQLTADEVSYLYTHSLAIPEPAAMTLLAMGLLGLLAYAWRKRK